MSHPGNDEIIDNERDAKIALSQSLVFEMTKFGIGIVQHIAAEILQKKQGMSVKDFVKVLDEYLVHEQGKANNNG